MSKNLIDDISALNLNQPELKTEDLLLRDKVSYVPDSDQENSSRVVYIGDLNKDTTETSLSMHFAQGYGLNSVRIVRNPITGESYRYAFANFESAESAQKAINALNFTIVDGNVIRMMQKKDNIHPNPKANIFIKNLDQNISVRALFELLKAFGTIESIKIPEVFDNETKRNKRLTYCFVQFSNENEANRAIKMLKDKQLGERKITAEIFVPMKERYQQRKGKETDFVLKYVPVEFLLEELKDKLNIEVQNNEDEENENKKIKVKSIERKEPRPNYKTTIVTVSLLNKMNKERLLENIEKLNVEIAKEWMKKFEDKKSEEEKEKEEEINIERIPKIELEQMLTKVEIFNYKKAKQRELWNKTKKRNVFFKNIPKHYSLSDFRQLCEKYGEIESIKLVEYNNPTELIKNKGRGFCCYKSEEGAKKVIDALDGYFLNQRCLQVGLLQNKRERLEMLRAEKKLENDGRINLNMMRNLGQTPFANLNGLGTPFAMSPFMSPFGMQNSGIMRGRRPIRKYFGENRGNNRFNDFDQKRTDNESFNGKKKEGFDLHKIKEQRENINNLLREKVKHILKGEKEEKILMVCGLIEKVSDPSYILSLLNDERRLHETVQEVSETLINSTEGDYEKGKMINE